MQVVGRIAATLMAAVVAIMFCVGVAAQDNDTVSVEVRVWQGRSDLDEVYISARAAADLRETLPKVPVPLDDLTTPGGGYRYADIGLDVPLVPSGSVAVTVRIWQDVQDRERLYISAQWPGTSWAVLGTIALRMEEESSSGGQYRHGGLTLEVPSPYVFTLSGQAGTNGYRDGPAGQALFGRLAGELTLGMDMDEEGHLIVADRRNAAIRRIAPDGSVQTIAGGNGPGTRDGPAETARFAGPTDVEVAPDGSIYVADSDGHRIRKISPAGIVTTVAGGGGTFLAAGEGRSWGSYRDGPADEARFAHPTAIALDRDGNLYVAEGSRRVRLLTPSGQVSTYAGGEVPGNLNGPRLRAKFFYLRGIDVDAEGNVYVIQLVNEPEDDPFASIRVIGTNGIVSTLFASAHPAFGGLLASPSGIVVADNGAIYLANTGRHQILRWTTRDGLHAVAGTGAAGFVDGGQGDAEFNRPIGLALSANGDLFVADGGNGVIRKIQTGSQDVDPELLDLAIGETLARLPGVDVSLFAGMPGSGSPRLRDGSLDRAQFYRPSGMALDAAGNILVADTGNQAIRLITPAGTVDTLAGGNGYGVRDGACSSAQFAEPYDVVVGADGVIFVADVGGNRIRTIFQVADSPDPCVVRTIAGAGPIEPSAGSWGEVGDYRDGPGLEARFHSPQSIALGPSGDLFIADKNNQSLRRLEQDGEVTTFARNWFLSLPGSAITVDERGTVLVSGNSAINSIDAFGVPGVVIETPPHEEGGALSPFLRGIVVGLDDALYVADAWYRRVVRITRDGEVTVVAEREDFGWLHALVFTQEGDLLVSAHHPINAIWRVSFGSETEAP